MLASWHEIDAALLEYNIPWPVQSHCLLSHFIHITTPIRKGVDHKHGTITLSHVSQHSRRNVVHLKMEKRQDTDAPFRDTALLRTLCPCGAIRDATLNISGWCIVLYESYIVHFYRVHFSSEGVLFECTLKVTFRVPLFERANHL